jgi:hypothetical protein
MVLLASNVSLGSLFWLRVGQQPKQLLMFIDFLNSAEDSMMED